MSEAGGAALGACESGAEGGRDLRCSPDTAAVGEGQRLGSEPLNAFFCRQRRFAVAFSGGCDSAYLLAAAKDAGCDVAAYLVKTAFQPAFELDDARRVADALGVPLRVLEADVLAEADICANAPDRCRLCKRFIFATVRESAAGDGFDVLADGTNASDDPATRPGFLSLAEAGVVLAPAPRRHRRRPTCAQPWQPWRYAAVWARVRFCRTSRASRAWPSTWARGAAIDEPALRRAAVERGVLFE